MNPQGLHAGLSPDVPAQANKSVAVPKSLPGSGGRTQGGLNTASLVMVPDSLLPSPEVLSIDDSARTLNRWSHNTANYIRIYDLYFEVQGVFHQRILRNYFV